MENKIKKFLKAIATITGCFFMFSVCAYAGTVDEGYNIDVGRCGGSYTLQEKEGETQIKTYTGRAGHIYAEYVGGGKKISCRMMDINNGSQGASVDIKTNTNATLYSRASHKKDDTMGVRFSNKLTTVVSVNSSGKWRSDNS